MNRKNNIKVLDLLYISVVSEGGDGDALWLSKYTSLKDIVILIKEYNKIKDTNWLIKKQNGRILWGNEQEWVVITDDKNYFESQPPHTILQINY